MIQTFKCPPDCPNGDRNNILDGIDAARAQYGKSLHFVTRTEHQRTLLKVALRERQLSMLRAFVQVCSNETERVENYCSGSHTQYSSMHWAADEICPKCGNSEDGPGGTIITTEPTERAKRAKELLNAIDLMDVPFQMEEKGITVDTETIKKLGDTCST